MMKVRLFNTVAIVSLAVAGLSGCVSYGNTHALVTPVGAVGYHTFKPDHTNAPPREINLRTPDRVAAANEREEGQQGGEEETR